MTTPIAEHVHVTIATNSLTIEQANFGTPMILSYHSNYADRVRTYSPSTALSQLLTEGFSATGPTYRMMQSVLGASPKVSEVKVGRLALPWTQNQEIEVTSNTEGDVVGCVITDTDGTEYDCYHTVGAGKTLNDVAVSLKAVIDAHAMAITIAAPGAAELQLIADNAGDVFYFGENTNCTLLDDTTDPTTATDLAAIILADDDWYCLLHPLTSFAIADALAGWTETQRKICLVQSQDSEIPTSGTGCIAYELKDDARLRTALIYPHGPSGPLSDYHNCAWAGKCLPKDPGSQTWCFKTLSGCTPSSLTPGQISELNGKNANHYLTIAGVSITRFGKMADGTFIDTVRLSDWFQARIEEAVFLLLAGNDKLPYTEDGIDSIEAAIYAVYKEAAGNDGVVLKDFAFQALPVSEQAAIDKTNRVLRDINFGGTLTSAVHEVYISGNLS